MTSDYYDNYPITRPRYHHEINSITVTKRVTIRLQSATMKLKDNHCLIIINKVNHERGIK